MARVIQADLDAAKSNAKYWQDAYASLNRTTQEAASRVNRTVTDLQNQVKGLRDSANSIHTHYQNTIATLDKELAAKGFAAIDEANRNGQQDVEIVKAGARALDHAFKYLADRLTTVQ